MSTFVQTEIGRACGVTESAAWRERARGVFREGGDIFVVAEDTEPALAIAAARLAFGAEVEYVGKTLLGRAYQKAAVA